MITFSKNEISKKDIKIVSQILNSGWLTHGKYTNLFEKEFAKFTSSKYAITVSSCTAALHLSCIALGFKKGDEIIAPAMTHTATSHAIEYVGAKVIFADIDILTGNLTLENLKKNITNKTKGVILVHMAGISVEIDKIINFCKKKKIKVIEDCAHAVGSYFKNKHVGNFGETGCFSFYPTKQITTGEGGILITNNKKIFQEIKKLKAFGINKDIRERKNQGEYDVKCLGFNYRMTDFQAALGYLQLNRYKKNLTTRKLIAKRYIKNLQNFSAVKFPKFNKNNSYFIFPILCNKFRNELLNFFKKKKIGVSVHYKTELPRMTYYRKKYFFKKNSYKNAHQYAIQNISLPIYPKLSLKDVDFICNMIKNFYRKKYYSC